MFKFLKFLIITIIFLGAAGYAVWHFGTNYASEKIFNKLEAALNDERAAEIKAYLQSDPRVKAILSDAASVDPDTLPFHTKEDATRVMIKKMGVSRLLELKNQAESGAINKNDAKEILYEIDGKLSEEEKTAFKYVLYKELFS